MMNGRNQARFETVAHVSPARRRWIVTLAALMIAASAAAGTSAISNAPVADDQTGGRSWMRVASPTYSVSTDTAVETAAVTNVRTFGRSWS